MSLVGVSVKPFQQQNLRLTLTAAVLTVLLIAWQQHWGFVQGRFPFLDQNGARTIFKVLLAFTILILSRIVIRNVVAHIDRKLEREQASEDQIFIENTMWKYGVGFLTTIILLAIFIPDWRVLLTSIGIIGAGIAVALQHTIMNFVGWLFIIFQKPYRVGDRIEYPQATLRGDVFDVSIMFTKLRLLNDTDSPTGKELYVPNEFVLTQPVINFTHPTRFIWDDIEVSITYESDMNLAKEICQRVLEEVLDKELKILERLSEKKRRFATQYSDLIKPRLVLGFLDSAIEVKLLYLVIAQLKNKKRTEIVDRLIEEVNKTDRVEFAYPHMHLKYDPGQSPR